MLREFLSNWSTRVEVAPGVRQAGALPYSIIEGRVAFLLITSRRNGRWIFPKGAIEPDMTAWDSAAAEALEEAGVIGTISQQPVGSYRSSAGSDGSTLVDIDLYPLLVDRQLDTWREMHERLRHWATLSEVKRLLGDPALIRIATDLQKQLLS